KPAAAANDYASLTVRLAPAHAEVRRVPEPSGPRVVMVGAPGFEPGTSASRTLRATKLRYAPKPAARAGPEQSTGHGGLPNRSSLPGPARAPWPRAGTGTGTAPTGWCPCPATRAGPPAAG